jgi:hypothetical protein
VSHIKVETPLDQALLNALTAALPSNSTLRHLDLSWYYDVFSDDSDVVRDLAPLLLALGDNTGLKILNVDMHGSIDDSMDESLCTAMKDGLGINTTLESLELDRVPLTNDNYDLWSRALSFLRTNKVLKSLVVNLKGNVVESRATAFRSDVVAMLQENASLGSLSIPSFCTFFKAEEYIALITALQHNMTLKTLILQHVSRSCHLTDDEDKRMASLLKKNYALESLPDINLKNEARDVGAILQLNGAGRRYLIEDGSSISKGVEVLSRVNNEINCVFLHLLENPRLCDRSAVEETASATTDTQGRRGSRSPVNHNGKREQDQIPKDDKESHRRRT